MSERSTPQKRLIKDIFLKSKRPLSVAEALSVAREHLPKMGQATVYRIIKDFVEADFLRSVDLPGDCTRYERCQRPHHHFFHCQLCEKVYEVPGCAHGIKDLVPMGFIAEAHELVFYGRCRDCA
ncbi:MAG: transcriptional repressor [Chlamydiia bacterium]|nr:transcriptional repressor [Chlamydiia bacterium]